MTLSLDLRPEPDVRTHPERWGLLADSALGLVTQFDLEVEGFPDEPSWPLVRADLAPTAGIDPRGYNYSPACGGRAGEVWDYPWVGGLFEAIERYCMSIPSVKHLSRHKCRDAHRDLDPGVFLDVAAPQTERDTERRRDRWWVTGATLSGDSVEVPAQSIYVPFRQDDWSEPLLRDAVSTGGAAGMRRDWAVVRGFLEAAERDAVMLLHYGVAGHELVEPTMLVGQARLMLDELAELGMSATVLRVHTGLPLTAVVVRVEDRRGPWPSAALGSCARLSLEDAVTGALLEAAVYKRNLRSRPGHFGVPVDNRQNILCLEDRASYWYGNNRLLELPYFGTPNTVGRWAPVSIAPDLHALMEAADEVLNPIVVDVTTSDIARMGAFVVKVVVPELQPMYLSEDKAIRSPRLGMVDLDDHEPHPFL